MQDQVQGPEERGRFKAVPDQDGGWVYDPGPEHRQKYPVGRPREERRLRDVVLARGILGEPGEASELASELVRENAPRVNAPRVNAPRVNAPRVNAPMISVL